MVTATLLGLPVSLGRQQAGIHTLIRVVGDCSCWLTTIRSSAAVKRCTRPGTPTPAIEPLWTHTTLSDRSTFGWAIFGRLRQIMSP